MFIMPINDLRDVEPTVRTLPPEVPPRWPPNLTQRIYEPRLNVEASEYTYCYGRGLEDCRYKYSTDLAGESPGLYDMSSSGYSQYIPSEEAVPRNTIDGSPPAKNYICCEPREHICPLETDYDSSRDDYTKRPLIGKCPENLLCHPATMTSVERCIATNGHYSPTCSCLPHLPFRPTPTRDRSWRIVKEKYH